MSTWKLVRRRAKPKDRWKSTRSAVVSMGTAVALWSVLSGCRCQVEPTADERREAVPLEHSIESRELEVRRLVLGPLETNAYIVWRPPSREALVIDPASDAGRIVDEVNELGLRIAAIALTHNHFDHAGALRELWQEAGATVVLHKAQLKAGGTRLGVVLSDVDAMFVADGDKIVVGEVVFKIAHVPGHAPGNICLHSPADQAAWCGDLLFAGNVGRVDLPGGSAAQLAGSLRDRLGSWSDETRIYPGHGEATTLGRERRRQKRWFGAPKRAGEKGWGQMP